MPAHGRRLRGPPPRQRRGSARAWARGAGAISVCGGGVAYSSSLARPADDSASSRAWVTDALRARRHGKPSGRGERSHVGEPCQALSVRFARARDGGPCGGAGKRVRGRGGRRGKSDVLRAGPQRWLARLAFRPLPRPGLRDRLEQLPDADARDVRQLRSRACGCAGALRQGDRAFDRGCLCAATAGTAAPLPGRVRLPGVCAAGGAAWS